MALEALSQLDVGSQGFTPHSEQKGPFLLCHHLVYATQVTPDLDPDSVLLCFSSTKAQACVLYCNYPKVAGLWDTSCG